MQREPAAKLSQVVERLDRIEHQIAAPPATASLAPPRPRKGGRRETGATCRCAGKAAA